MEAPSNLRILVIGINYEPELTGIGPYTAGLAEYFAEKRHSVRVVTGLPHYPDWRRGRIAPDQSHNPHVSRHWHYIPHRANALGRMLYELTWFVSAAPLLRVARPDVVIGIIPSLSGGLLACLSGRRFRAPVGLVFQDLMGLAVSQSGYRGASFVSRITRRLEVAIARSVDRIATISPGFSSYLINAGVEASRIHHVRNWTRLGPATEPREAARTRLGWAASDFVCLHAGNMGQKQGLDNLLEAAQLIQDPRIRIVLAGEGNDRERLVKRARTLNMRNVQFLGLQPGGAFESILQAADVLLLNQRKSVGEMNLPSKLSAYFAAGRPVIAAAAAASNAAAEVVASGSGMVVPPENAAALANAIQSAIDSPDRLNALGARGRTYASINLSPDACLAAYDGFLERLTGAQVDGAARKAIA